MRFKENQNPLRVHRILFVIVPLMIFIIVAFGYQNSKRIQIQNQVYTKEIATGQAESMDELIDNCSDSILMYADMANSITDISQYEKNSPFESLFLVGKSGVFLDQEKTIDVSSTDIIIRGIQGKSGIMVDYNKLISDEVTIVFYAPVFEHDEVNEVVVGTLAQTQMENVMDAENFGYSSLTCLISTKGDVISGSKQAKDWIGKNLFFDYHKNDTFLDTTLDELPKHALTKEALSTVLYNGGSFGYQYKHEGKKESAYLVTLYHSGFAIMKVFPSKATAAMEFSMNRATLILSGLLILLFAVYLVAVVIDYMHKNKTLKKENETVHQILAAFYGIYDRFCIVDLLADTYEYFQMGELSHHGIENKGKYSKLCEQLSHFVDDEAADGDIWARYDSSKIKSVLTKFHPVMRNEILMTFDEKKWENVTFIGLDYKQGSPRKMIFAVQDITAAHEKMVRMNQMLKEASKDAQAANEAKSDFLSRMSHDIRTPLNGILGMTTIAKHYKDDPKKMLECLEKIDASGQFLLGLVNEILDISKIEAGKMMLDEEDTDMNTLLTEVHDMIQISTKRKKQELVWENTVKHSHVIADKNRLQSILLNILSNAVKYTPEHGTIAFTATEKKKDASGHAVFVFECKDNGIGMTKEFLDVIFEPFARDENKFVQNEQGTGLGLSIVQSIARLMGGDVTVTSKLGEGSNFVVHVSLKLSDESQINDSAQIVDCSDEQTNFKGNRCLLVDDNELNREIATEILGMTEITIETACDGKEAVDLFLEHPDGYYQMIFMDIQMPIMNGYEASRAIRASGREDSKLIPIVAMTANAYVEDVKAAVDAGMNEHLAKPINVDLLYQVMRKYLRSRE